MLKFYELSITPLSTISSLYRGSRFLFVEETGVSGENHRPAASHWEMLSHNVVSITGVGGAHP